MQKIRRLRFFGFSRGNIQQNKSIKQQSSCKIKKQITDSSLIKYHSFTPLTNQIANIQNPMATTKPNSNTRTVGLSIEGTMKGITVEPKNNCPSPIHKSASLSSCESESVIFINSYGSMEKL